MRTRDAALAVNYSQQARDCACGCGGGCLHTAVKTAARDAAIKSLYKPGKISDTWSPAAREAAARTRKMHSGSHASEKEAAFKKAKPRLEAGARPDLSKDHPDSENHRLAADAHWRARESHYAKRSNAESRSATANHLSSLLGVEEKGHDFDSHDKMMRKHWELAGHPGQSGRA